MKVAGFDIFPLGDREQEVRLRRFFIGTLAHLMNLSFVFLCWVLQFFSTPVVLGYLLMAGALNLGIFLTIRSGLNKRFKDPSLTFIQIALASLPGLYLMYFAGDARSIFLVMGVTMFVFGMFNFKTRDFIALAALILLGYALLILLLVRFHGDEIKLKVELLQWLAFAAMLVQFSFLAGFIGNLRFKVQAKNQELATQNLALESALKKIGEMAIRDELTGVYNRRYLMEKIAEETQRSQRNGAAFCVCMIDIDFFKNVNDSYGHLSGDQVLRMVAGCATEALRQTDSLGRFGGEEFLMLLTDTALDGAMVKAERVRQAIEKLVFSEIHSNLRVTVSIGVAEHGKRVDAGVTIMHADEALYRAKEAGRNRCIAAALEFTG